MNGIAFAIIGHLVGDYILQDDWQALNKKKSNIACGVHCLLWTSSVMLMSKWFVWWVPIVLFVTHFIQDRSLLVEWFMARNNQSGFLTHLSPWSKIAVDNVMHILVIAYIAISLGVNY